MPSMVQPLSLMARMIVLVITQITITIVCLALSAGNGLRVKKQEFHEEGLIKLPKESSNVSTTLKKG